MITYFKKIINNNNRFLITKGSNKHAESDILANILIDYENTVYKKFILVKNKHIDTKSIYAKDTLCRIKEYLDCQLDSDTDNTYKIYFYNTNNPEDKRLLISTNDFTDIIKIPYSTKYLLDNNILLEYDLFTNTKKLPQRYYKSEWIFQ